MNLSLIQIGNSRGVRLPKKVIDQCHVEKQLRLTVEGKRIILEPVHRKLREGWATAAIAMHDNGDDQLLMPDAFEDENFPEW